MLSVVIPVYVAFLDVLHPVEEPKMPNPRIALVILLLLPLSAPAEDSPATKLLKARTPRLRKDVVKVGEQVYVAVGYTPANVSMVVGTDGIIIIDTGMGPTHAKAILEAFRKITDKPVKAVIYTHGHGDHTGGAGVFINEGKHPVEVWARPNLNSEGDQFKRSGIFINRLRGARQGGFLLPPHLRINNGIAPAIYPSKNTDPFAGGTGGFVPPNRTFGGPRRSLKIAGERVDLVAAPGETDDQLYVWLPTQKVVFTGDNFYRSWPNLYAIRGTPYRDVQAWIESVDAMVQLSPRGVVPGHTRPIAGEKDSMEFLSSYRDAVRFVFEKTVEGINKGMTPDQLVHYVKLPRKFSEMDHLKEYYGNVEWAVRAIFTGYLGWFDGNPTTLFSLPLKEEAKRMADLAGGADKLQNKADAALKAKDYQWAAQLADHLIALDADAAAPKLVKADALTGLAQNLLTATGRNYYLTVAQQLRRAAKHTEASKPG